MTDATARELFLRAARLPEGEIDLARAALLLAAMEYPSLDIDRELGLLDSLASAARSRLDGDRDPLACANRLSEFLFDEMGFRGNREDYYDPRNSYLNDVLSRRLGIPITLALVYIEVGRRSGIPLAGIGMPGHFLVGHREAEGLYIDPFHGGILLSREECAERLRQALGEETPWDPLYLAPIGNRDYIARMVRNLKGVYMRREDHRRALGMIEWLLRLEPPEAHDLRDRGLVYTRMGQHHQALADLRGYLEAAPYAPDAQAAGELVTRLERMLGA